MFLHGALDTKSVQWQQVVQIEMKYKFVQDKIFHSHTLIYNNPSAGILITLLTRYIRIQIRDFKVI